MSRVEMKGQTAVVSDDFCSPKQVKLIVAKKLLSVTDCNFEVTDEDGKIMFKVKEEAFSLRGRHLLLDARGTPFLTVMKKHLGVQKRWQVFKGESSNSGDLLFTARTCLPVQLDTNFHVFLRGNENEREWDFKVEGRWQDSSCILYAKGWKEIAKIHNTQTIGSVASGSNAVDATVYPKVDSAFVVALLMILYENNQDKDD